MTNRIKLYVISFCLICPVSQSQVVINEIMYNARESGLEYIELFNPEDQTISLSGWVIKDDRDTHSFLIPSTARIAAGGYHVIANDAQLFLDTYGFRADADGVTFNFSNTGDAVRLFDASGSLAESVDYDDRSPWSEEADGLGPSLERINPLIPAVYPAAWKASSGNGTPGKRNSVYTVAIPPIITDIDHTPRIPQPNESITVTARVLGIEKQAFTVRLKYGWNGETRVQQAGMLDDGNHGDGQAGDGVYGASIDGGDARDIFHFYIEASDDAGSTSLMPEEGGESPYLTAVENELTGEQVSIHRVVMLPEIRERFLQRYTTDEYFPATFYDGDTVYYRVHVRHRGRSRIQNGRFKIRFPHQQLYRGKMRRLNYNGTDTNTILREYLSFQLYQDAGLPNLESELVRFHINGSTAAGTAYRVMIENPDTQFVRRRQYFSRDDGNLYKTTLDGTPDNKATWRYAGDDPALYSGCYIKQTNEEEADYSDIIQFCRVLSESDTWDDGYLEKVNSVINPDDFLRWMAVSACVAHWDSPFTDHGHNYVMYNNPATGQFHVIAWDLNGTFSYTSNQNDLNYRKLYTHIRSTKFPAINKILNHPVFGGQYYREIDRLMNTLFSQKSMDERIGRAAEQLKLSSNSVSFLKTYVTQRNKDLAEWINQEQGAAFLTKPVYQCNVNETYLYHATAVDYLSTQIMKYRLESSPAWLKVDERSGLLAGVPSLAGRYDVVLIAETSKGLRLEQPFSIQVTEPNPIVLLNFNEESGAFQDGSGNDNNATARGTTRRVSGRLGNAVYMSGSNAYVEIPHDDSLNLTGSVTVEAWINPDSISSGNPVIVTKGDADNFNYTLMLGYGPFSWDRMEPCFMPKRFDIENRVYYGRKEMEAQLRARQWVHIAGTYDSASELVCVYANNRRIVESSNRTLMPENSQPLRIGLGGSRGFRGTVDDVKILPFAKQAFAAGLCISQLDVSGISSAQDRFGLSLSEYRTDSVNTGDYCIYIETLDRWLALPDGVLAPGKTLVWWLDDTGLQMPLPGSGSLALYPMSSYGLAMPEMVLDTVCWGEEKPAQSNPGVRAGLWLASQSVPLSTALPVTLSLSEFADNDEMAADWSVAPQALSGPFIDSLSIENGAENTTRPEVELTLAVNGSNTPWTLRISNTPDMGGEWQAYNKTVQWLLPDGDGMKTVYVQVADSNGLRSPVVSSSIRLGNETRIKDWERH